MALEDMGREGLRLVSQLAGAAVSLPVVIAFTALGAGVVVGRGLVRFVSGLLPAFGPERPSPRHNAARIRERARAALRVARTSGLLSQRRR